MQYLYKLGAACAILTKALGRWMIADLRIVREFELWLVIVLETEGNVQVHGLRVGIAERQQLTTDTNASGAELIVYFWCDRHAVEYYVIAISIKNLISYNSVGFRNDGHGRSRYHVVGARLGRIRFYEH